MGPCISLPVVEYHPAGSKRHRTWQLLVHKLTQILQDKKQLKKQILAMPKSEAKQHIELIRLLVLTDNQIIDAAIATYFEIDGMTPVDTQHRVPPEYITGFANDKDFFYYISDLLKERIS
jgi:hypothetical protein